jgi:hypothetical protein
LIRSIRSGSDEAPACRGRYVTEMTPVRFCCHHTLPLASEEIARRILDLANWADFTGYGFLPGIRVAEFELRTPDVVGSRIRVTNTDGSTHVEEIVDWQPDRRLQLRMQDFSAPLSRLATRFDETWEFQNREATTEVTRSFELQPRSTLARPFLWLIALFLKRAVARHLRDLARR